MQREHQARPGTRIGQISLIGRMNMKKITQPVSAPLLHGSLFRNPRVFGRCALLCLVTLVSMCAHPVIVQAAPQGGNVIAGEAAISVNEAATVIDQFTDKAIINWRGFSIDINELVRFIQPGAGSVALNRVTGAEASAILGELTANGRVFLLNPNGILFGAGAKIDVGALTATTFDIEDGDFLAGRYRFRQDPDHDSSYVINRGEIKVAENGFAYLVAPSVGNEGLIIAEMGRVVLGSGDEFTIDFSGDGLIRYEVSGTVLDRVKGSDGEPLAEAVSNSGTINADGGRVVLTGDAAKEVVSSVVCNDGVIRAGSLVSAGGSVNLLGRGEGEVANYGTIDVSAGEAGAEGGNVALDGQYTGNFGTILARGAQGADGGQVLLDSTTQTLVSSGASIDASGGADSSGGSIILLSDTNTAASGSLIARGGEFGGDGGFIEVSSEGGLALNSRVDTLAPAGETGTLLIDPHNVTIAGGGAGLTDVDQFNDDPSDDANINAAIINAAVAAVTIQANNDIFVTSAINIVAAVSLTLQAGRDVNINDNITTNSANIDITANDQDAGPGNHDGGDGNITMADDTAIDAGSGTITLTVDTGSGSPGDITIDDITTTGNVTITSYGDITEAGNGDDEADITAAALSLTAGEAGATIGEEGDPLEIEADSLEATTNLGHIVVTDLAGGLELGAVNTGGNDSGDGTRVILEAVTGALTDTGGDPSLITAWAVNLTTSVNPTDEDDHGGAIGSLGDPIKTDAALLSATADDGGIFIEETDGLTINSVVAKEEGETPGPDDQGQVVLPGGGAGTHDVAITATAGDIMLGDVTAPVDVTIEAPAGQIIDNNETSINVTAQTMTLIADGAIGQDTVPIETTVEEIDATTTNGGIFVAESDGATSVSLAAGGTGDVSLTTTGGDLELGTITAADGTVTVETGDGALLEDGGASSITADTVSLISTDGVGSSANPIATDTDDLTATATESDSPIYVDETDGLDSVSASVKDSDVLINSNSLTLLSFNDDTDALSCSVTDIPITFANTDGNIALNDLDAGTADVTLTASGAITQSSGTLTADTATLTAGTNIGANGSELATSATELDLTASDGGVYVEEADAVTVTASASGSNKDIEVSNTTGDMTLNLVSATGDVTLTATAGSLVDNNGSSTNVSGSRVTLTADTAIGTSGDTIETDVDTLDATSQGGGLYVTEQSGLARLDAEATGGDMDISASGDVTIGALLAAGQTITFTTSGDITDNLDDDLTTKTVNITALTLNLTGRKIGVSGGRIEIAVAELVVDTTGGGIYIHQPGAGDLDLTSATAIGTGGNVEIEVKDGIELGAVEALGDRVVISSTNGAITDGNGAALNVESKSLEIDAPGGVGTDPDPLEFKVDLLSAAGGGDGVAASNAGPVSINADSLEGKGAITVSISADEITVLDNGGTIDMEDGGSLVLTASTGDIVFLNQDDTIDASGGGSITLQADGSGAVIVAGNLITSDGGDITLQADYNITIGLLNTGGDGDVTVRSQNGIILDGNGAATNIIADTVTLIGYTPEDKDAEIAREKAIAEYYAKISEAASKETIMETYEASNTIHENLKNSAQVWENAADADYNSKKSTHDSEKATWEDMYEDLKDYQGLIKALVIAKNVAEGVMGGAQAVPFSGDGGMAVIFAVADIALSVAELDVFFQEQDVDTQETEYIQAADDLDVATAQLYAAKNDLVIATEMAAASEDALKISEAAFEAAEIARDHAGMVEIQAIDAEDIANVIGTASQALGIEATKVDITTFRTSSVYLYSPGELGLGDIDAVATGNDVIVTAFDDINVLGTINSPDRVWIESTDGAILGNGSGSVVALELIVEAFGGIGAIDSLNTAVEKLAADGGDGGVGITNTNGTTSLYITTLEDVIGVSGDGDISVSTSGDLKLEKAITDTSTNYTVTLTSIGGAITDDNQASVNVTASSLVASAATGIEFDTNIDDLEATTSGAGAIVVREEDAIELTDVTAANGTITVDAGGSITAVSVVSTTDDDDNDIELTATGGGDITVQTITAGGTSGDVTLTAADAIDDDDNDGTLITGDVLTLTAPNGIGGTGENTTRHLDTTVKSLTATVATGGEINIEEADDLDVTSATTANGDVTITSAAGSLNVTEISADTTDDTVTLIANEAITDAVAESAADNLTADNLALTAGTGIGTDANPFEVTVANLEADGGSGGIYATDLAGGLIIGGVTPNLGNAALTGLVATGGNIEVTAASPITIDEAVTNSGTGDIEITAGASEAEDDLTISASISSTGASGNITLTAADAVDQAADINVAGDGDINITATAGDIDMDDFATTKVDGTGDIDLAAGGGVTQGDYAEIKVDGAGNITITATAGHIDLGEAAEVIVNDDGNIDLTATAGHIDLGEEATAHIDGTGDLTFTATAGSITLQDDAAASIGVGDEDGITFSANTFITLEQGARADVDTDGDITFTATTGNITLEEGTTQDYAYVSIGEDGTIDLDAAAGAIDLELKADISVGTDGNIDLTAANGISLGQEALVSVEGAGSITANATGGAISLGQEAEIYVIGAGNITATTTDSNISLGLEANISAGTGNIDINSSNAFSQGLDSTVAIDVEGDVTIDAADGDITMATGSSTDLQDGDVSYNASGSIAVNEISTQSGNAELTATAGDITDVNGADLNITADDLTATAATGIGEVGDALDTTIDTFTGTTTGAGPIVINETDGIELTSVTTDDGLITVSAGGTIDAVSVVSSTDDDANDITITATGGGSIAIDAVNAGTGSGDVTLTANTGGGAVTTNISGRVTGDVVTATAVTSVSLTITGQSADLSVTGVGDLEVTELDAIELTDLDTDDGSITVTAGGTITALDVESSDDDDANDITLTSTGDDVVVDLVTAGAGAAADVSITADGSITELVAADAGTDITADNLTLDAGTGIGTGAGGPLDTAAVSLAAESAAGDINLDEADDVTIQDVTASDGDVTITSAAGAIDDDNDDNTLIAGDALTLTAPDGIGTTGANATRSLDTDVTSLSATASIAGQINIAEEDNLDIISVAANDGDVTITSAAGDLDVTSITADTADDTVTLIASAGAITDAADSDANNVTAADLAMTAAQGIGTAANPLEVTVDNLEATGGTGGIYATDLAGGLVIGGVTPGLGNPTLAGLQATGGDIIVMVLSPLTVDEEVTNSGGGDITFTAGQSGAADDITVNADVNATGGNGNVSFNAADSVEQNANISASGTGDVTVEGENGDVTMATGTSTTVQNGNVTYGAGDDLAVNEITTTTGGSGGNVTLDGDTITDVNNETANIIANNISVNTEAGTGTQADAGDMSNDTGFLDNLIGGNVPNRVLFNNRIMGGAAINSLENVQHTLLSMADWFDVAGLGLTVNTLRGMVQPKHIVAPAIDYRHDPETGGWDVEHRFEQESETSGLIPVPAAPVVPGTDVKEPPAARTPEHAVVPAVPEIDVVESPATPAAEEVPEDSGLRGKVRDIWARVKGKTDLQDTGPAPADVPAPDSILPNKVRSIWEGLKSRQ